MSNDFLRSLGVGQDEDPLAAVLGGVNPQALAGYASSDGQIPRIGSSAMSSAVSPEDAAQVAEHMEGDKLPRLGSAGLPFPFDLPSGNAADAIIPRLGASTSMPGMAPLGMAESLKARSELPPEMAPPMGMAESLRARAELDEPQAPNPAQAGPRGPRIPAVPFGSEATQKKDYIKDLYGDKFGDKAMDAAIGERRRLQFLSDMGKAGKQFSEAMSRGTFKADTSIEDGLTKRSGQDIEDVKTGRKDRADRLDLSVKAQDFTDKQALRDPESPISKAYRDMAKQTGMAIPGDATAFSIKELMPMIDMRMKMEYMQHQKKEDKKSKQDQTDNKDLQSFLKRLDEPFTARSGTALGQAANTVRRAEAVQAFAYSRGDLDKLNPQQIYEVSAAVDSMLRGGNTAVGTIKHLIPSNIKMNAAGIMEWVTSNPTGAGQAKFVENFLKAANVEKDLAEKQIGDHQAKLASGFRRLENMPEFQSALTQRGLEALYEKAKRGERIQGAGAFIEDLKGKSEAESKGKAGASSGFPKDVKKNGQVATVSNEAELAEAKADGWE